MKRKTSEIPCVPASTRRGFAETTSFVAPCQSLLLTVNVLGQIQPLRSQPPPLQKKSMSKVSAKRMYDKITHDGVLKQAWENAGIVVYAQKHPSTGTVFRTFGTMDYFRPVLLAKPYDIVYVRGHPLPLLVAVLLCKYFFLLRISAIRRQDLKMVWSAMDTLMLAPLIIRPDVQPYLDAAVSKYYGRKQEESKRVREFILSRSRTIDGGKPITMETSLARVRKDRMPDIKILCLHLFAQANPKMLIGTQILDLPISLRNLFVKTARTFPDLTNDTNDTQTEKDMKQAYLFAYDPTQIYSRCGTQTVPCVIPFAKDISCSLLKPGNEKLQEDCSTFMMASGLHVSIFDYIRPWNDKRFLPLSMDDFNPETYFAVRTRAQMQEEKSLIAFEKRMTAAEGASSGAATADDAAECSPADDAVEEEYAPSSSFDSDFWEEQRHLATEQKNTESFWGDISLDDFPDLFWVSSQESQSNTYGTLDPDVLDMHADELDVQVFSAPSKPDEPDESDEPGKPDEPDETGKPATSTPSTPAIAVC